MELLTQKSELLTPAFASDCGHNLQEQVTRDAKNKKIKKSKKVGSGDPKAEGRKWGHFKRIGSKHPCWWNVAKLSEVEKRLLTGSGLFYVREEIPLDWCRMSDLHRNRCRSLERPRLESREMTANKRKEGRGGSST